MFGTILIIVGVVLIILLSYLIIRDKTSEKKRQSAKREYTVHETDKPLYNSLTPEERKFVDEYSEEMLRRHS